MKSCDKCGNKLEEGQKFCQKCGEPVNIKAIQELDEMKTDEIKSKQNNPSSPKKPVSKGWIVTSILLIILIIGGYFTYQYGQDHYSRRNQIDRLVTVLSSEDYKQVASILTSADADLDIDEETIVPFIDTYLNNVDHTEIRRVLESERQYESLRLVSDGSYFFLFDRYALELQPAFVTLTTNMEDVTLSINDEEVAVSNNEDFSYTHGPLIPGEYTFRAVKDMEGELLETAEERNANSGQDNVLVELPIYGLYFTVESNKSDASVYLNDEKIGILENGSNHFGPYGSLEGSSLELRKEESFGELKTSSSNMTDYDEEYYYLTFDESLSIGEAENALSGMFNTLSDLTRDNNWNYAGVLENFGKHFYEGIAFDELRPFYIEYAQRQREDEDTVRTVYNTTVTNFEQVNVNEYTVKLEVDYVTEYDWSLDKEDRLRTFTYNVSLVSDEAVRDTWGNNQELFINGFANEELIFDSNN